MRVFPEFTGPMFAWPRVEVIPHAEEVLAELQDDWLLGLATNAVDSEQRDIRLALERVGLDRFLDRLYCYRLIGHRKPSSEFFDYILDDLGLALSKVMMVGDDFGADVLGANRCGIRAIWFNSRSDEVRTGEMYRTIHDLRALPAELDSLWDESGA